MHHKGPLHKGNEPLSAVFERLINETRVVNVAFLRTSYCLQWFRFKGEGE